MTRPGVEIISRDKPVARTIPTNTGVWFVVGHTTTQPTGPPKLVTSMTQYEATYGARGSGSAQVLYDAVETYFREGGARLYVSAMATADTDYGVALDVFTEGLGPGQVSAPGVDSTTVGALLLAHAKSHNRVALIDAPLAADTAAELITAATALRTDPNARYGALFAPHAIIPGVTSGTTRSAPWSAVVAGIIARNDVTYTANQPGAGVNGVSLYALDLAQQYTDQEYEDLNEAGVDLGRVRYGTIENYGWRTLVDPNSAAGAWLNLGNARLNMQIVGGANAIAERYVFSQLDGRWRTISDFGGELSGMLVPFYEAGALYGATAQDAFFVDVGEQVNTPATIAAGELHALIECRMSPFAELVVIEIVKVSTVEALAASAPSSLATAAA